MIVLEVFSFNLQFNSFKYWLANLTLYTLSKKILEANLLFKNLNLVKSDLRCDTISAHFIFVSN